MPRTFSFIMQTAISVCVSGKLAIRVSHHPTLIEHYSDANTEVRASNQTKQKEDWDTYTKRWEHLRMPKEDWIVKPFKDKHKTAKKYWSKIKEIKE